MRQESAPQYALGKNLYAAKTSGKNSAAPKIISFFRCERKKKQASIIIIETKKN